MVSEYLYQQLESWLLKGIEEQRWRVGDRLPSIRALCKQHALSKATVQHALQRLEAQGLLEARPKAGYFVTFHATYVTDATYVTGATNTVTTKTVQAPASPLLIEAPRPVTVSELLLDIMRRSAAFDLLPDLHAGTLPAGIIALNRSVARALRRQRGDDYQYYDAPAGDETLRAQLALHQLRRGWQVDIDELCITSGCQHALFLALMATCEKGDVVAVESPGFYGVLQLLEQLGLQVIEVPTSITTGMEIEALEEVLQRWKVKACVVSPAFSTPGGALMPKEARLRLLALAEQHDLAIIEDDIYADTALGVVPDPLKALDEDNRVIHCSSFSKSLSRDLRLGWISGARWHDRIIKLKLVTQLTSSCYLQRGVAEFMADGSFTAHLRRQRHQLRERRDRLISHLREWSQDLRISLPQGGLAVWVELSKGVDTLAAYPEALERGVVITPGPLFSVSGQFRNCMRISFSHPWDTPRVEALNLLSDMLVRKG